MKRTWIVFAIILGLAVIGIAGYLGFRSSQPEAVEAPPAPDTVPVTRCDVEQTVTAPGNAVNTHESTLRMPLTATVQEVMVLPGESVQAGDTLLTLSQDEIVLALAQAQMNVLDAEETYQKATRKRSGLEGVRTSNLSYEQAQIRHSKASEQLKAAHEAFDSVVELAANDFRRLSAWEMLVAAKQEMQLAQANLNWYSGNPSRQELNEADAEVTLAEARLTQARNTLALLQELFVTEEGISASIRAPFSGVILEVKAQAGETVANGSPLFTLTDPAAVEVEVTVVEEDYPYVEVGQPVDLFFDALPQVEATGKVSRIIPERVGSDRPLYVVYLSLNAVPEHLVEGMTADAAIQIAGREGVLCLPRALVRASSGTEATVTVWNGVATETRTIEVGLRGDVYVEILSGLEEGEQVVSR